ncbi:hypothetical protein ACQCVB_15495 [Fictibacillus phosphorivorans]|uniref:hypothetical protein n=1 Tax=Fictibacillus phosphorivorans TaxID=1221500 RepID=UPI003CEA26A7
MYSDTASELRSIRKTLIVLGILLFFTTGANNNVTIDHNEENSESTTEYHKNLVPLGNGYFGLYSGDVQFDGDNRIKIYYYDEKENKLIQKAEENLDTVEVAK